MRISELTDLESEDKRKEKEKCIFHLKFLSIKIYLMDELELK